MYYIVCHFEGNYQRIVVQVVYLSRFLSRECDFNSFHSEFAEMFIWFILHSSSVAFPLSSKIPCCWSSKNSVNFPQILTFCGLGLLVVSPLSGQLISVVVFNCFIHKFCEFSFLDQGLNLLLQLKGLCILMSMVVMKTIIFGPIPLITISFHWFGGYEQISILFASKSDPLMC